MQKTTLRAMMLFTLLTLPQAVLAGSITYDIVNYPDLQNGWTLSGTITTDATMGPITQLDITSWTWSITKVVDNIVRDYTFRSTDPGGVVAGIGLTATSSELLLPFSDSNSFSLQTKAAALFDGVEPGPFGIAQALHTTASNQTGANRSHIGPLEPRIPSSRNHSSSRARPPPPSPNPPRYTSWGSAPYAAVST